MSVHKETGSYRGLLNKLVLIVLTVFLMTAVFAVPVFAQEHVDLLITPEGESNAGESIVFEAIVEGVNDPEFQFGYRRVGGKWLVREPGPSDTYTRTVPGGFSGGVFQLGVRVREAGTSEWLAASTVLHTINSVKPSVTLTINPAGTSKLGNAVIISATSVGVANPEYRFGRRYEGRSWGKTSASTVATRSYTPGQLGKLYFGVQVREKGGPWLDTKLVTHEVLEDLGGPDDDYSQGEPAPLETTPESSSKVSKGGEKTSLSLSDGTNVTMPAISGSFKTTLTRTSNTLPITGEIQNISTLQATGSIRQVSIIGNGNPANLRPVITFPAKEAGTINSSTISVIRVGDLYVDGKLVQDHAVTLPVTVDQKGNLSFIDPLMPSSLIETSAEPAGDAQEGLHSAQINNSESYYVGNVKYMLMSFQDDLNWKRKPRLIRMVPDATMKPSFRRPAQAADLVELAKQPITNVVILVHGHNEEEKGGTKEIAPSEAAPWFFTYKRLVWNLLYEEALSSNGLYPHECTAFYEFVYPSYHPTFSPVVGVETLGEAMGRLVEKELKENAQLAALIKEDMPFNVFIIAHSQGGLVARAGVRHMPKEFMYRLERLITWGTPHHGSALTSTRYALQAGHDLVYNDRRIPLQNIQNNWITGGYYRGKIQALVLDTPGTRDLRWDVSKKNMLRIHEIFPGITSANESDIEPSLYSDNFSIFNNSIHQEIRHIKYSTIPYSFLYGVTSKTAELDPVDLKVPWMVTHRWSQGWKFKNASDIEKGTFLNSIVMNGYTGDGAVPIYSQQLSGLAPPLDDGVKRIRLNDIDHEEFYGGEGARRNVSKGRMVAAKTFEEANFLHESRSCPLITDLIVTKEGLKTIINGKLNYSLYDQTFPEKWKGTLGKRIERVEARAGSQKGAVINELVFVHNDSDASFRGEGISSNIPEGSICIVVIMKDGSEVAGVSDIGYQVRIQSHSRTREVTLQRGHTEHVQNFEATTSPAGEYRFIWDFGDGNTFEEVKHYSSSISHTYRNLKDGDIFYPKVTIYPVEGGPPLATDSITVKYKIEGSTTSWSNTYSRQEGRFNNSLTIEVQNAEFLSEEVGGIILLTFIRQSGDQVVVKVTGEGEHTGMEWDSSAPPPNVSFNLYIYPGLQYSDRIESVDTFPINQSRSFSDSLTITGTGETFRGSFHGEEFGSQTASMTFRIDFR